MLAVFKKVADRILSDEPLRSHTAHGYMITSSLPSSRSFTIATEQMESDIALWKGLGAAFEATDPKAFLSPEWQLLVALGACVWDNRKLKNGMSVQVHAKGRLIAVLDSMSMQAYVRSDPFPSDASALSCTPMLAGRAHIPDDFEVFHMWDLLWHFGYSSAHAWKSVPVDYAYASLELARLPLASQKILPASALKIIRQLMADEATFAELVEQSKLPHEEVFRCIVAMYITLAFRKKVQSKIA
jgi:hypothetical protein